MSELSELARVKAAHKKARGSISLKNGRILSEEGRAELKKKSENTPYLDKMLSRYRASKH